MTEEDKKMELIKLEKVAQPLFGKPYYRFSASWYFYDSVNAPQKHIIVSALIKEGASEDEVNQHKSDFMHHVKHDLLFFLPVDREKINAERAKQKKP